MSYVELAWYWHCSDCDATGVGFVSEAAAAADLEIHRKDYGCSDDVMVVVSPRCDQEHVERFNDEWGERGMSTLTEIEFLEEENDNLRALVAEILNEISRSDSGYTPRGGQEQIAKWWRRRDGQDA